MTIDENLVRAHLSDMARAEMVEHRKPVYEELHPETRNGETGNGREKLRKFCEATPDRFTLATAKRTGRSERAVQLDVQRAKALGAHAHKI